MVDDPVHPEPGVAGSQSDDQCLVTRTLLVHSTLPFSYHCQLVRAPGNVIVAPSLPLRGLLVHSHSPGRSASRVQGDMRSGTSEVVTMALRALQQLQGKWLVRVWTFVKDAFALCLAHRYGWQQGGLRDRVIGYKCL